MDGQKVDVPSANQLGACPAIVFGDPKATKKAVIVLQEWWGMNQQIQDCGKDLCMKGGFATLVPDLYRGKVTTDNEEAGHFMGSLDWKGAIADIQGAARYLRGEGAEKVGVVGFCMGGALSMATAALVPEIDASVPFYGIPSTDLCDVTKISIPLQCHFAEKDHTVGFASPKEWKPLKVKLEENVKNLEFYEYDSQHAFANVVSPYYDKDCAAQAYKRMFEFFEKYL